MSKFLILALMLSLFHGCAQSGDIFGDIGNNISGISAMSVNAAANRLYVVNANSRVYYDSTQGSFQVYDITNPRAPSLIKTAETLSFSGEVYVDAATNTAFIPNRYTANDGATQGQLFNFNVDEGSPNFLTGTETAIDKDAFAIDCCYPANRAWITTWMNELQYVDVTDASSSGAISLITNLDNGSVLTNGFTSFMAIIGNQAFLSRTFGGIMVVNLDEVGVAGSVPMDYLITDIESPRGIATDGTRLYVVGEGSVDDTWTRYMLVIDPSTLVPRTDNTTTALIDKDDSGILQATVVVGNNPQQVILSTGHAFVTNQDDDTVTVIDIPSYIVNTTIPVGDEPFSMALYTIPGGADQYVYVGNATANNISIIDIPSLSVAATYP